MTFLEFNMKLNEIISAWLEDGGDPARCAEALRALQTEDDQEHDEIRAEHDAWVRSGGPRAAR